MSKLMNDQLYRAVVLTILGAIAVLVTALANRNVYSKEAIDQRLQAREQTVDKRLDRIHDDVRWIMRHLGGSDATAEEDSDSP